MSPFLRGRRGDEEETRSLSCGLEQFIPGASTCILETGSAEPQLRRRDAWLLDLLLSPYIGWLWVRPSCTLALSPYLDLKPQFPQMTNEINVLAVPSFRVIMAVSFQRIQAVASQICQAEKRL